MFPYKTLTLAETMETGKLPNVTAQEMRTQLSDLLNRAAYLKETTLITRQGKAVAVLVSVEDWEEYLQMKNARETREAEAAGQRAEGGHESVGSENGRK